MPPARNSHGGPEPLLALGLRSYSDIPELKALERYFDSAARFSVFGCLPDESDPFARPAPRSVTP